MPKLIPGTLIRRYKRFLADVELADGRTVTAHCPNSGSMIGCSKPGRRVYLSSHDRLDRKLKYTWEIIDMPGSLVGVNTLMPNRLVYQSLASGFIKEFAGYDSITSEVKVREHSRLDIMLSKNESETCYMEVKNCTLVDGGIAYFPDAVTARGRKHLEVLQELTAAGNRCAMFFLIQRMDASLFKPADHIDPDYGRELRKAYDAGVEIVVFDVKINLRRICLGNPVSYIL